MKLMSLNTWGCRITESLYDFISNNKSFNVFCFQEILKGGNGKTVRGEIKSAYEDIQILLPDHLGYFQAYGEGGYYSESSKGLDFEYGIACFVDKNLQQSCGHGINLIDQTKKYNDYSGRFAAGAALSVFVDDCIIVNVHGLWQGSIKTDTEAKIDQSRKIIDLVKGTDEKKLICGDFNLLPDTVSIQMISEKYKNLVEEYNIRDTRGLLYTKENRYSDYAFVDKSLSIENFSVPLISISDHLPLIIEFSRT